MVTRAFLAAEAAVFGAAALVHAGVLMQGYAHASARNAETVIALVLFAGLLAIAIAPAWTRTIGIGAQGFALLGTGVGLVMIAIGVGPRSPLDLILHGVMVTLLVTGLVRAERVRT
jgi:prepilin signal peptidase PulO-like enzyme (type II secretory pathway)